MNKLTKVQKTTRFIVYTIRNTFILSIVFGILPAIICGNIYHILGI